MSFLSYSKNFRGVVDAFMNNPSRYQPFVEMFANIMNSDSELSTAQREMIAFHVSKLNGCHYCSNAHESVLIGLGVDEATISAIETTGTIEDARMVPVLAFAAKLAQTPGAVVQADVDHVRDAGWSDQTVEDVIGVVLLFSAVNRLVDGLGIRGSDEMFAQDGEMISQHGYGPLAQMLRKKAAA